jgi:hypothetical protein
LPKREKERGGRARQTVSLLSEVIIMREREWDPKNFPFQKRYFHLPKKIFLSITVSSVNSRMNVIVKIRLVVFTNLVLSVILSLIPVVAVAIIIQTSN